MRSPGLSNARAMKALKGHDNFNALVVSWFHLLWQDDFRLRHSAKDPRTCPRKADFGELSRVVGMAPGVNGYEGSCGPGFSLQGEPVSSNRLQKRRESLAEAQSSQRKTRGQGSTFDFYLSLLCKRLKSCQLAKTSSSEVVFHLPPSWLSLRALRLCERFFPPSLAALPPGAMPTTRLSSPKSALRGHVFSLEARVAERIGRGGGARCRDVRIRQHLTTATQGAGRTISGYDILPRIQGHAHAKPTSASSVESWAWDPARPYVSGRMSHLPWLRPLARAENTVILLWSSWKSS